MLNKPVWYNTGMMKTMPRTMPLCAALALLLPLLLSGCGGSSGGEARTDTVSGTGTIHYKSFEGGFYAIDADNGNAYDPTTLAPEFSKDGLRVHFEGTPRPEKGSIPRLRHDYRHHQYQRPEIVSAGGRGVCGSDGVVGGPGVARVVHLHLARRDVNRVARLQVEFPAPLAGQFGG